MRLPAWITGAERPANGPRGASLTLIAVAWKGSGTLTISFGPITQSYTSKVTADPQGLTVTAMAVDGPFAYLDSKWSFAPEGEGTRIRFDIDFKFSNPLIAAVAEPAFASKQDEIIDAFGDEADRRFGD